MAVEFRGPAARAALPVAQAIPVLRLDAGLMTPWRGKRSAGLREVALNHVRGFHPLIHKSPARGIGAVEADLETAALISPVEE